MEVPRRDVTRPGFLGMKIPLGYGCLYQRAVNLDGDVGDRFRVSGNPMANFNVKMIIAGDHIEPSPVGHHHPLLYGPFPTPVSWKKRQSTSGNLT